jgi:imidazole glycerol-phosphate synthase subunit HisH
VTAESAPLIAVLDYGIGNLRSAEKALQRMGGDARLTADPGLVADADAVVLPGVGAFRSCMQALHGSGLGDVALAAVASGRPFLGICVGMQMLFDGSEENPGVPGLGVFGGLVRWLPDTVKRPQMQWNVLETRRPSPLLEGLGDRPWVYFVHSLHAVPDDPSVVVATAEYGTSVTAMVQRGTVAATQFHPEKSGTSGLALLGNFVRSASLARAAR